MSGRTSRRVSDDTHPERPQKTGKRAPGSAGIPYEELDYVEDYGKKIRDARTKMGLSHDQLARILNEKSSIIKKVEQETFRPPLQLVHRLEKFLKIRLLETGSSVDEAVLEAYRAKPTKDVSLEESMKKP